MIVELVGFLIVREVLDIFTPFVLKKRVDTFIFLGLFIFALIIGRRVLMVLEMV